MVLIEFLNIVVEQLKKKKNWNQRKQEVIEYTSSVKKSMNIKYDVKIIKQKDGSHKDVKIINSDT